MCVQLPTDSLFPFGATRLDPARMESWRDLAQHIGSIPDVVAVCIQGHIDRPSRSGAGFSQRLSAARARAVGNALVAYGVSPVLIDARAHGDTMPLVDAPVRAQGPPSTASHPTGAWTSRSSDRNESPLQPSDLDAPCGYRCVCSREVGARRRSGHRQTRRLRTQGISGTTIVGGREKSALATRRLLES